MSWRSWAEDSRSRPGLGTTGWGLIEAEGNRLAHIANGQIKTDTNAPLPRRLSALADQLEALIADHRPAAAAVEEVFVNKNPQSTLKLGQARGVVLMCAARAGIEVGRICGPARQEGGRWIGRRRESPGPRDGLTPAARRENRWPRLRPMRSPSPSLTPIIWRPLEQAAERHCEEPKATRQSSWIAALRWPDEQVALAMIARLTGILAETASDSAVIDVAGVGYHVHCSARTLDALGPIGGEILILTELQVREDAWTLFGFGSAAEREFVRALTSVQGVGGKVALAILSVLAPDDLARAVAQEDKAMIGRANGVGPKLAARIANELQGKLGVVAIGGATAVPRGGAAADALSAFGQPRFQAGRGQRGRQRCTGRARSGCDARRAGASRPQEGGQVRCRAALLMLLAPLVLGGHTSARSGTYAKIDRCLAKPEMAWDYRAGHCKSGSGGSRRSHLHR